MKGNAILIHLRTVFVALAVASWVIGCTSQRRGSETFHQASLHSAGYSMSAIRPGTSNPDEVPDTILAWDAKAKTYRARPGEDSARFVFNVTNVSPAQVVIETTATSCGCTVAELPADPWKLPPGGHGRIEVTMDLNGQTGAVTRQVTVFTSKGTCQLTVEAVVPEL